MKKSSFVLMNVGLVVIGLVLGLSINLIVKYFESNKDRRFGKYGSIESKLLQEEYSPNNFPVADAALWLNLVPLAKVCENCSGMEEFAETAGYKTYPIIVDGFDREQNIHFTVVVGTVFYDLDHKTTRFRSEMAYYLGNQMGGSRRFEPHVKVSSYRDSGGQWHNLENQPQIIKDYELQNIRTFFIKYVWELRRKS